MHDTRTTWSGLSTARALAAPAEAADAAGHRGTTGRTTAGHARSSGEGPALASRSGEGPALARV